VQKATSDERRPIVEYDSASGTDALYNIVVDNIVVDNIIVDNIVVDNIVVDNIVVDNIVVDNIVVDNIVVDNIVVDNKGREGKIIYSREVEEIGGRYGELVVWW
jgi:hypothetical protein